MRHDAVWRRTREPREALRLGAHRHLRAVRAPFDGDERATQAGQGARLRRRERKALRLRLGASVQERTGAAHARVEVLEEGVVDDAEDRDALVDQA